jgi:holo-[acyl-carrier protein] synthase
MCCHGLDIIEITRVKRALECWGTRFLERVYTRAEIELCRNRAPELASRFAAKEAVAKALRDPEGISWRDIEVLREQNGAPLVHLHGQARIKAEELGVTELTLTLSHSREYAIASVVGRKQ